MLGEAYWREFRLGIILCQRLLSPVVIGGIVYTCFPQVILNRLATLLQVQLQYFKFFFRHNTITVVVVCTIADAKVQRNYNCYNVYFNECLPLNFINGHSLGFILEIECLPRGLTPERSSWLTNGTPKTPAATPFMAKSVAATILKTLLWGLALEVSF